MGDTMPTESKHNKKLAFQSKELENLLDVIDNLRLQGITGHIDLPQLIVCGDQSSGKSSVLEALSGVQFPMKDNLCTRHPTEVILRRKDTVSTTITIVPDPKRSDEEKRELQEFKAGNEALVDFGATVEAAGVLMGLQENVKAFSTDVLRVEVTGPTLPQLTLVDLPGLFHSGNKTQSDDDAQVVKDLVTSYMERPRSIILAVVSAKNDYANQVVTKHARSVDPRGERTLGIITKPDLLDQDSSSEKQYLDLAQNTDVVLRLGWHVLKNRDYKSRDCSIEQRNKAEAKFFAKGIWTSLHPSNVGIESLKVRLSRVLQNHIKTELPSLTREVVSGIKQCEDRLDRLGFSRATLHDQRKYLHRISQEFSKIIQNAVAGHYNDPYFEESSDSSYPKRIRAVVANRLEEFATTMRIDGKQYMIVSNTTVSSGDAPVPAVDDEKTPIPVTEEQRIARVAELIRNTRGRELPGFIKFETVSALFKEQCQPWESHIKACADEIFSSVRVALHLALDYTCDESTKEGILHVIVDPALDGLKKNLNAKVLQNLQQHTKGHPITFNHYFTDNVQKLRNEHQAKFLASRLVSFFNPNEDFALGNQTIDAKFNMNDLAVSLVNNTEADMEKFACSEALHFMNAYYKVALKFFIDDFSIHTIEQGFLETLEAIFSPNTVFALTDTEIEDIAGESEESKEERANSSSKLAALQEALKILHRLHRGHTTHKV